MKQLTFITGNAEKAAQLGRHLSFEVEHKKLDIPEIQSLDLEEVAVDKAKRAYEMLQAPVLVEDTALTFTALGSLPGPLIKWFLTSLGNEGLAKSLDGYDDRSARAEVCFVLHDESGPHLFKGRVDGSISDEPQGEKGFGWDPVFIPNGHQQTWGQMDVNQQRDTSMRREALLKLQTFLEENYK